MKLEKCPAAVAAGAPKAGVVVDGAPKVPKQPPEVGVVAAGWPNPPEVAAPKSKTPPEVVAAAVAAGWPKPLNRLEPVVPGPKAFVVDFMAGPLVDDGAAAVGGAVELPNNKVVVDAVLPLVLLVAAPNSELPKLEVPGVAAAPKLDEDEAGVVAGVVAGGADGGGAVAAPPKLKVPGADVGHPASGAAVAAGVVGAAAEGEDIVELEEEEAEAAVEEVEEGAVLPPPKLKDMLCVERDDKRIPVWKVR